MFKTSSDMFKWLETHNISTLNNFDKFWQVSTSFDFLTVRAGNAVQGLTKSSWKKNDKSLPFLKFLTILTFYSKDPIKHTVRLAFRPQKNLYVRYV